MDSKPTKKERRKNNWLDDVDKLEVQSKKMRKDATKVKYCHGKPLQESQVKKNHLRKAKEKWSFIENDNIGRKKPASGKERKTWNSRCGTDIGVFKQVINDRGKRVRSPTVIAMTDDNANAKMNNRNNFKTNCQTDTNSMEQETVVMNIHQENPDYDQEEFIKEIAAKTPAIIMGGIKQEKSTDGNANVKRNTRKNLETNDRTAKNTSNSLEQETVVMNIQQENPDYDQEEEIQIIKEIAAKTPATIKDIKQEKSIYQPRVIITSISENAEKESQSRLQSTRESSNEETGACKEPMISTPTDKYPAFPSNTQLPETPTHNKTWDSLHFNLGGLTITPVGPATGNSFSTSSEARETSSGIPYGASRSCESLAVNNRSGGINGTNTPQNNSSLFQDGTTPRGPSTVSFFSVSSETDTGRILDGATISQRKSPIRNEKEENTGRAQDGTRAFPSKSRVNYRRGDMTRDTQDKTATSQSNSPPNDRSNTPVNGRGDITGRAQDRATAFPSKSQVNYRSVDMTRDTQDKNATSQSNSPSSDRSSTPVNERGDNTRRAQRQEWARASTSKYPVNYRSGDMIRVTQDKTTTSQSNSTLNDRSNTPVNGSGDITGRPQDVPTASPVNNTRGDIRGHLDEAAASQGNSPGKNERRNTTERANNEGTDQGTKPPENITITVGGGDLTLKNGELSAQMKINDVCMKGAANDVANFVKEATRAVQDLVK